MWTKDDKSIFTRISTTFRLFVKVRKYHSSCSVQLDWVGQTWNPQHRHCRVTPRSKEPLQLPNADTAPNTMICGAVYTKRVRKNNTSKILTSIPLYPCTFINSMLFSNTKEKLSYSCPPQHDSDLPVKPLQKDLQLSQRSGN